jgi:hypothetical protein
MKPRHKMMALTFALILPFLGLAMYIGAQNGDASLPTWFQYFAMFYFLGTILIVSMYIRRIRRNAAPGSLEAPRPGALRGFLIWQSYLVIVWSGFFIYGAYQTIAGELDWKRSVPAGAFLLVFIAIFSGSIYKMRKRAAQQRTSASQKTPASTGDSTVR